MEYTFNANLNFVNLLLPHNNANFFLYCKAGFGQFVFSSELDFKDPEQDDISINTGTPELVLNSGIGAFYRISPSFDAMAEGSLKLSSNDKLDGSSNKKDEDYYTYISIGITYRINNSQKNSRNIKFSGKRFPLIRKK